MLSWAKLPSKLWDPCMATLMIPFTHMYVKSRW